MVTMRGGTVKGWVISVALLGLLGGTPAAAAQDLNGTRSTGMGGTLRAAPSGETALLLNPAGMTLNRTYVINGCYQYRGSDAASLVNVSVVDSVTKRIAAGLYYSYVHASPKRTLAAAGGDPLSLEQTLQTHEAGLALAYPLANMLHLGITGKYVNLTVDQPEETPDEVFDEGASGITLDIGVVVQPITNLNLGVSFQNAIPLDHDTYPRMLGMGIAYAFGTMLLAEFDTVLDFDRGESVKPSYHGGLEAFLGGSYAIRGGVMHDTFREATYATGGLGLVARKIALDFGLRQMVDGGAETLIAFSVRLFLQ